MLIKPQDTLIALKFCSIQRQAKENTNAKTGLPPHFGIRSLADVIGISHGEISRATKRLINAQLIVVRKQPLAVTRNLMEWISYGMRYYCSMDSTGYGRGIATGWNCPLIESEMLPPSPGWAWASLHGEVEAELIRPFHESVPLAAAHDPWLYKLLSLIEVIRGGKPRELSIARDLIAQHLGVHG